MADFRAIVRPFKKNVSIFTRQNEFTLPRIASKIDFHLKLPLFPFRESLSGQKNPRLATGIWTYQIFFVLSICFFNNWIIYKPIGNDSLDSTMVRLPSWNIRSFFFVIIKLPLYSILSFMN